ncbi:YceI family protein [Pontibacter rugosus]|uniref:YceI family protein n=1 Tax=Pontibacter rugosus TaxID=1745966 RepID=A0ABW3SIY9_9BACT
MAKHHRNLLLQLALLLFTLSACDTTVKTDEAVISDAIVKKEQPTPAVTFAIDTAKSEITWIGAKMTGRHNGVFDLQHGELYMTDDLLTGGHFVIDMTTTRASDKTIDAESNKKLTTHLRSADFFDSERFPTAEFELTGIAPYDSLSEKAKQKTKVTYSELRINNPTHRLTGNLTIKGQTKSIAFPARVTMQDSLVRAKANFNIDRTKWGLIYRSDQSLGDQTIHPEVNIGLDIVAKPQKPTTPES